MSPSPRCPKAPRWHIRRLSGIQPDFPGELCSGACVGSKSDRSDRIVGPLRSPKRFGASAKVRSHSPATPLRRFASALRHEACTE
jgi:hypothetical protein